MRKNLFLTLALSLVAFAGINAQDWSVTLTGQEGLPGSKTTRDGVNVTCYKTGIIRPEQPITSLRFTVTGTRNGEKPNGNLIFVLSELNVFKADGKTEVAYTSSSNADHMTITKSFDGQGLAALNDGKFNNYFHSMWGANGAVTDYHYIELEFAEPLESFILEWGGRPNNTKNDPTVVGLTEGGVDFVPYTDRAYSLGEPIESLEALAAAEHITMQGNADTIYNIYNNETGELTEENTGLKGSGPMFAIYDAIVAKEATPELATKLIPVEGKENTYLLYFPNQKTYLSRRGEDNQFNAAHNGWQTATADKDEAAEVVIAPHKDGGFEMSYDLEFDSLTIEDVYIGADPRSGKMKTFAKAKKESIEKNGRCEGFGIKAVFNWTFYATEFTLPAWSKEYTISKLYVDAVELKQVLGAGSDIDDAIALAKEAMENLEATEEEMEENIAEIKYLISAYIKEVLTKAYKNYTTDFAKNYKNLTSDTPREGYYKQEAYDTYLQANILDAISELMQLEVEDGSLFAAVEDVKSVLRNVEANIDSFLSSKYAVNKFPATFTAEDPHNVPLGTKNGSHYDWTQSLVLNESIDGIRITFLETNVGNAGGGGKHDGYPMVALSGLEILDGEGNKVELDATLVTTNSLETSEGSLEGLFDYNEDGSVNTGTFYHSIWGNGDFSPKGYVYLDVKFPEGVALSTLTVKTYGRDNGSLSPGTVAFTKYGVAVDPAVDRPNTYNVKMGAQVEDPAQLKDGGLYLLSGNLRVNKEENPSEPRYYSGVTPYSENIKAAENDPCVYMFKKVEGGWNIVSLINGQYWTESNSLSAFQDEAAVVNFSKSQNLAKTMVIYSEMDTTLTAQWNWTNPKDSTCKINVEAGEVKVTKRVFMDWDSGLASRPCVSEIPGQFEYGLDQLPDSLKASLINESSAGDYLHFNKTNGEGEWNIIEVAMDDPYFVWMAGLIEQADDLGLIPGKDPGCVNVDEETKSRFNNAQAAAKVAIAADRRERAESLVKDLVATITEMGNSERVGIDPEAEYRIDSDITAFLKNTWYKRSIYVKQDSTSNELGWTLTPQKFVDDNLEFIFKFIPVAEIDADLAEELGEEVAKDAYFIYNEATGLYAGAGSGSTSVTMVETDMAAAPYVISNTKNTSFHIYNATVTEGGNQFHANGHGGGSGYEGNIIYYNVASINNASSWNIILMDEATKNSVENVVVEGDAVVATAIYTPAGVATANLEKGVNIVVKVYANGVVKAEKVLVK